MEYGKQESQIDREPWDLSYVCRQTSLVSRDPSRGRLGIHGICSASVNPFVSSYDAAGKQLVRSAFCPAAAAMTSLQYSTQMHILDVSDRIGSPCSCLFHPSASLSSCNVPFSSPRYFHPDEY